MTTHVQLAGYFKVFLPQDGARPDYSFFKNIALRLLLGYS